MRLKRLEIRKLYGSLNKDVDFNPELNLLVGINGSGKTSVLNVVDWLLRADLPHLATTPFERLTLTIEHGRTELSIEAIQTPVEYNVYVRGTGEDLAPFNVRLMRDPNEIVSEVETDQLLVQYSGLGPEPHERKTWDYIKNLPKPTVIALDRTISAEADERVYIDEEPRPRRPPNERTRSRSPLGQVTRVTSGRYAEYRSTLEQLNDTLKARMVLSALRDPEDPMSQRGTLKISPKEIEKLEKKVIEYVSTSIKGSNVASQARHYFRRIRSLTSRSLPPRNQDFFWMVLAGRFHQLEDMASAFNEFETKSAQAYEELGRYMQAVNRFFTESRKELAFNEKTNQLAFRFLSDSGTPEGDFRNIRHLSSGERQILILLTFLAFSRDDRGVFIVDEPELSLHPKWQSEFLEAFLSLKPSETQLLLATHSPEIVGAHKEACVVLLP